MPRVYRSSNAVNYESGDGSSGPAWTMIRVLIETGPDAAGPSRKTSCGTDRAGLAAAPLFLFKGPRPGADKDRELLDAGLTAITSAAGVSAAASGPPSVFVDDAALHAAGDGHDLTADVA